MYFLLHVELNIIIHIVFPLKLPQEFLKLGATANCAEDPIPSAEDLADQIIEVLNYFGCWMREKEQMSCGFLKQLIIEPEWVWSWSFNSQFNLLWEQLEEGYCLKGPQHQDPL
ncbi:hypothetical protein GLYMA_18G164133v4 [Glycine max]|uniref:uncharacterized protein LOC114395259 n=1 Tax=Glycine soja TaxID=3848 RepID=UPI0007193086|nr:uncharacterized protein LOC114395259 [Glycine soja]KAG4377592.1 hypothetical protein GLYMA_18G164133v4 [Glycine max]KAH1154764.1 hypothetical protein GYH30_050171 [Glycine max]|eukprot:XP_014626538.1 uncharacterized protein LOC106797165 [Glycine max]